jgi:hypothetical protein
VESRTQAPAKARELALFSSEENEARRDVLKYTQPVRDRYGLGAVVCPKFGSVKSIV